MNKKFLYRSIFYVIGILFITLGISLTYKTPTLGSGAYDALNLGLSATFGHSVGFWIEFIGILFLLIEAVIRRGVPRFFALIPMFLEGTFIDFWMKVLEDITVDTLLAEAVVFALGVTLIGLGIAVYIQPNFAPAPVDLLMVSISERFKISIRMAKTILEATLLVLALFVGGPIGLGTILMTLTIGPIIQFFIKPSSTVYGRLIR